MSADSLEDASPEGQDPEPDRAVVTIGLIAVLAVAAWAALGKNSFDTASSTALAWVPANFAWLFVIAADVFPVICVVLAISRFGRIRLGAADSEPEPTNLAWIAMMYSADVGIGLMFYGVGEPLTPYLNPPPAPGAPPGSATLPVRPWATPSGTAIRLGSTGAADLAVKVKDGAEASLFAMLDALPLGTVTSHVAMALAMTYFVTSADSASLLRGSLPSLGSLNPPTWHVVTWGVLIEAVAAVLLVADGLNSLQTPPPFRSRCPSSSSCCCSAGPW